MDAFGQDAAPLDVSTKKPAARARTIRIRISCLPKKLSNSLEKLTPMVQRRSGTCRN